MTNADRLIQWNRWFDSTPEGWRTHIVMWPLVAAGFLNMQLSIAGGFPFGVLVLLTILAMAAIRVPYTAGWIKRGEHGARFEVGRIDRLHDINRAYDGLPELTRFWLPPAILIAAGTLNIVLLAFRGWAFGSLFLVALLALVAIRAPYAWGMITPPPAEREPSRGWFADTAAWYAGLSPEGRLLGLVLLAVVALVVDGWLAALTGLSFGIWLLLDVLVVGMLIAPRLLNMLLLPPRREPPLAAAASSRPAAQIAQQHHAMTHTTPPAETHVIPVHVAETPIVEIRHGEAAASEPEGQHRET